MDEDVLREYCKGYVQVAQRDGVWTSNQAAFNLTLPLLFLSGYVEPDSLQAVEPEAAADPLGYFKKCAAQLPDAVISLYEFFADARAKHAQSTVAPTKEKLGRNDACPCGSGKKFKRCCG
jgi:uncharacterized protein